MNNELKEQDIRTIVSILSDIQEVTDERVNGKLNLIKGVLLGKVEIQYEGLFCSFKNKNTESRFCDKCGLLRVGEYRQCQCPIEVIA